MPTYGQLCLALTSAEGFTRRYFPGLGFDAFDATIERFGGFSSFSISCHADVSALASLSLGDCVEAWFAGVLRYRGYVEDNRRAEGEPPTLRITGNGISFQAGMQEVAGQYLYPGDGVDVSAAFADVAREAVQANLPTVTVQAQTVGATVSQVDGTYRQAGAVFNDLITGSAENLAVWGGDVDTDPASPTYLQDRLYIRPLSQKADYAVPVPGARTEAGSLTTSLADVKNRLRIIGGPPKWPNLFYNGSFERLRFAGPEAGNLLLNASFEDDTNPDGSYGGDGQAQHWTITGGAFVHAASDGTGAAYQGDRLLKIDVGGQAEQTHNTAGTVTPGTPYVVGVYAARESGAATGVGRLSLQWLGAGDSNVGSAIPLTVNPTGTTYDVFDFTRVAPVGATGLRVTLDLSTVVGAGSGVKFDEAFAFDASTVFADKWELAAFGAAGVTLQSWRARGAYDGLRCLQTQFVAADSDGNDLHLQPAGGERVAITPRQTLVLSARVRGAWPKFFLEIEEYKSDGSFNQKNFGVVSAGSSAGWTLVSFSRTLDSATTHVLAYLNFRGSTTGDLYVDALSLRDAAAPAGEFVRDGNFTVLFDSDDSSLDGTTNEAVNSRVLFTGGVPRYEQVSSDLITTLADARSYAAAWFNAHAVPLPQSPVTVLDDPRAFVPGQGVRLIGADGPTLMAGRAFLPVMRVQLAFGSDGIWRQTLEIQQEVKDAAEEILDWLARKARLTAVGSAASSTAGTSTGAGSPFGGPLTVTDGTSPVGGVNILKLTGGALSTPAVGEADFAVTGDHKVSLNASDTAPGYLDGKVGADATLAVADVSGVRTFGLPGSGATAGTYGDATHTVAATIDAQGRVTGISAVAITFPPPGVTSVNTRTGAVTLVGTDIPAFVASGASHAAGAVPDPGATAGTTKYLREDGTWQTPPGSASGTVTSVALTVPGVLFSVSGSPITGSGTIAFSLLTQTANTVLAGPTSGAAATPTMRALVAADLPVATASAVGVVKPGGTNLSVDGAGTLTARRGVLVALCLAYTPTATGADAAEIPVPYDPTDGTTGITWNVRAIDFRVNVAGGAPSVTVEKSTATGAFSAATVGTVTLGSGAYEGRNTASLGTVASGSKLRFNGGTLGTATGWTIVVELGE